MELIDRLSKLELAKRQKISRADIKEQLQLLSSIGEQLEYQRNVPHVNITGELICGQFDDNYWPEDKIFRSGFTGQELEAMANFNDEFRSVRKTFPNSEIPQITDLVQTLEWKNLTRKAHDTLKLLR